MKRAPTAPFPETPESSTKSEVRLESGTKVIIEGELMTGLGKGMVASTFDASFPLSLGDNVGLAEGGLLPLVKSLGEAIGENN
jgi:hypothetical protein